MLVVGPKLTRRYLKTMARSTDLGLLPSPTRNPLCIAIKIHRDEGLKVS